MATSSWAVGDTIPVDIGIAVNSVLNIVTLGVSDIRTARQFYEPMGWTVSSQLPGAARPIPGSFLGRSQARIIGGRDPDFDHR